MDLSVVIPAYNEAEIIISTLDSVTASLDRLGLDYEIIISDDGSTDGTRAAVDGYPSGRVRSVGYELNKGKGAAVRTGMLAAKGRVVICTDADLALGSLDDSNKGDRIFRIMYDSVSDGADIAIGSRRLDPSGFRSYSFVRRLTSEAFHILSGLASGLPYDTQCGMKAYAKPVADRIFRLCSTDRFAYDFEVLMLARKMKYDIREIPVRVVNFRESKVRIVRDSLIMFRDVFRIRRRVSRFGKPW